MRELADEVFLITDVTGDLGRELVHAAVDAGARRIYACAPIVIPWESDLVVPTVLDSGSDASVSRLCAAAPDVTVLITTTTTASWPPVAIGAGDTATLEEHFAVTVLGTVRVAAAFAPTLAGNGGGVLACVESAQAWVNLTGAYAVAQSALWSAVNSLRTELRGSGVHVLAAVGGWVEADHPSTVVAAELILQGIRSRKNELLIDDYTAQVRSRLSGPIEGIYPELE